MQKSADILIEDGKLIPVNRACVISPQIFNLWRVILTSLYSKFCAESGRSMPDQIIPFDHERIIRFLATNGEPIENKKFKAYGMVTLVLRNHGTGRRFVGHIEDVFTDPNYRWRGYAEKLVRAAIDEATKRGVIHIDLTSRPERTTAHQLYKKLGFRVIAQAIPDDPRSTNLFRLWLQEN